MKKMKKFLMSTLLMVGLIVIPTMTFNAAGQQLIILLQCHMLLVQ